MKRKLKALSKQLIRYKEQLEERHKAEPLKSPPVFLLNAAISELEQLSRPARRK